MAKAGLKGVEDEARASGGRAGKGFASSFASGIGPGMGGISALKATVVGLGGSLLGALPAVTALGAGVGVIGTGFGLLMASNKKFAASVKSDWSSIQKSFESAAAPLTGPLLQGMQSFLFIVKTIQPELKAAFQAAGPLIQPLVDGLGGLVEGILPGLVSLLKAAFPAFDALSVVLTDMGAGLGQMFSSMAPAIKASANLFYSLGEIINALFPILGTLTSMFANALAPIFGELGAAIQNLLPVFQVIGKVIASFAGAVLTDLVSVLGSLGTLIKDISPSLSKLATAFGEVFTQLENSGTFAILGDALESLTGPLAKLINALVNALVPILPVVIKLMADLTNDAIAGLAIVLTDVANAVTALVTKFPQLVPIVLGVVAAVKLWSVAQAALNLALDANPIGLLAVAVAAIAVGFYTAWEKSSTFRDIIKDIGKVVVQMGIMTLQGLKQITDGFDTFVGAVIDGAAKAFGWVPGIGPLLRTAAKNFDGFRSSTDTAYDQMINKLKDWQNGLNASSKTVAATSKDISADFTKQARAASDAKGDIDQLDVAIGTNGATSTQAKAARQQLIKDMENAGVKAHTAKTDVDNYSSAVAKNGTESAQAQAARKKLITDLLDASKNARQGRTDLANYTNAVKDNGAKSTGAQAARKKLISDLENAGLSSKAATTLVNNLTKAIKAVPTSKKVTLTAVAHGTGKVVYKESFPGGSLQGALLYGAAGGVVPQAAAGGVRMVPGYAPGQDSQLAHVSPGEAILAPEAARALGYGNIMSWNKRFSRNRKSTGLAYSAGGFAGVPDRMNSLDGSYLSKVQQAADAQMVKILKQKVQAAKTAQSLSEFVHVTGSGVTRWTADVLKALSMEGLPSNLAPNVLYQMQTESGGNPNAINLSDSNAAMGDPSRGLMQTIMSTFRAYHWPGTSNNIYDPLANIAAAINYARHVYGPSLANHYGGIGSGHGYSSGGATSAGWATVGEHGRELIKVPGGATVYPHGVNSQGSGGMHITLELGQTFKQAGLTQAQLEDIRYTIRTKGGGSAQRALGTT